MILARLAYATEHLDPQYHTKESMGFGPPWLQAFLSDRDPRNSPPAPERRYPSPAEAPHARGPVPRGQEMLPSPRGGVNVRRAAAIAGASLLAGGGAAGAYHMHKNRKPAPAPGLMDRARDLGGRAASAARRNPGAATAAALTPFAIGGGIAAARNRD